MSFLKYVRFLIAKFEQAEPSNVGGRASSSRTQSTAEISGGYGTIRLAAKQIVRPYFLKSKNVVG